MTPGPGWGVLVDDTRSGVLNLYWLDQPLERQIGVEVTVSPSSRSSVLKITDTGRVIYEQEARSFGALRALAYQITYQDQSWFDAKRMESEL